MKKLWILSCIVVISCAGAEYLLGGEQIGTPWNGKYFQSPSGNAYLNVGIKEVQIRGVIGVPNAIYNVDQVISQETELKVWLSYQSQYVSLKMTRVQLNDSATTVFINTPVDQKDTFPVVFERELSMVRY